MTLDTTAPPPGTLRLIKGEYHFHKLSKAEAFLFVGDPTTSPVRQITCADGVSLPVPRPDLQAHPFRLHVLHINDLHAHLCKFTPHGYQSSFSKIVWRMQNVARQCENDPNAAVIILSAGDDLVGAVFDELLGDDVESFRVHAGYRMYTAAGLHAATLGNHDLDMGVPLLAEAIRRDAKFPVLSANLVGSRRLTGLVYPAALLVTKGVRVGIIGLTTPAALNPKVSDSGLHLANPVQVVRHLLPAMRNACDVVIVLSHLGYSLDSNSALVAEAGDVELARNLPPESVHLIVGGHTHHALNEHGLSVSNIVNNIPIVQAGAFGQFLGEVDITLHHGVSVTNARLTRVTDLPVDETFERDIVQPFVEMVRPLFGRVLGQVVNHDDLTSDAVQNYFAAGESALANFIADAMVARCRANGHPVDLAVVDASCVLCGLPVGERLTFGQWFNMMPFADTIELCRLTGEQLKLWLTDNARRVDRPGEPHCERGFLQFSRQLRYTLHLGQSRSEAYASDITINGIPIEDQLERSFLVACSSFLRKPAAAWEKWAESQFKTLDVCAWPRLHTDLFLRDEMVVYIRDNGGVTTAGGARRDGRLQLAL